MTYLTNLFLNNIVIPLVTWATRNYVRTYGVESIVSAEMRQQHRGILEKVKREMEHNLIESLKRNEEFVFTTYMDAMGNITLRAKIVIFDNHKKV